MKKDTVSDDDMEVVFIGGDFNEIPHGIGGVSQV